jgi:ring-1,2-phenylacetyl-CoA epoxidase subunit PaaE
MSTQFHSLKIEKIEKLTDDAIAVIFDVPQELKEVFTYKQGQYLTLSASIDNTDVRRAYSICAGVGEQQLKVGIKRIDEGVFSTFANHEFKVGMSVDVMPPQGEFSTELTSQSHKNYLFVAVGSGITPILSHIKSVLALEKGAKATLIYGNKTSQTAMFYEELSLMNASSNNAFKQIDIYSQQTDIEAILSGRVGAQKLIDLNGSNLIDLNAFTDAFLCGPQSMVKEVVDCLKTFAIKDKNIFYELFFVEPPVKKEGVLEGDSESSSDVTSQVTVTADDETVTFSLSTSGDYILDVAMEKGLDLPYSCQSGVCASCRAKVIEGKVTMDVNHSLSDEEVDEGYVLTCQSRPVSDVVKIEFE